MRYDSVTNAAHKLRLAQPTISSQLKTFEETLGEKLFEREGRKLKLTEAGNIAYQYAEKIFSLGQELFEVLDGKQIQIGKELKIGISDVVPKSLAYRLIEPALNSESGDIITCLEDKTDRLLADLAIGDIDLVIADRPITPNVKVKAFNHFIGECGVSFLAVNKIAKLYKKNFPHSLLKAPLLLPTTESCVRHELDQWFEKIAIKPRCAGIFQDRALMKIAARGGKGVIPVPSVVEREVREEFKLDLVGKTKEVKEQLYLISIERRLKNPLIMKICVEGQQNLFGKYK